MAGKDKLFSRSIRGFAPDEVIAYIDELNAAHKKVVFENESRISELTAELENLENLKKNNAELVEKLAQKDNVISQKDEEISLLKQDTENQKLAIAAQAEETEKKIAELSETKSALEALEIKNAALESNSKEYESMLADVDSILATARRKAEELIKEAESVASEKLEKAKFTAESIVNAAKGEAKNEADRIMSQVGEKYNENLKKVKYLYRRQDELAELFRDHKSKVENFFSSISDTLDGKEKK